jgi:serine O-acetyltransferase
VDQIPTPISAEVPDWMREKPTQFWDPGRKLLLSLRRYQIWCNKRGIIAVIARKGILLRYRFWSVVTGADISLNCQIGGGLLIPHPNGIVIHPDAKIGVNCLIFQQVTIGSRQIQGLPEIGTCRYWRRCKNPGTSQNWSPRQNWRKCRDHQKRG